VDEALVTALEAAVADTGALVVRLQKYRRGAGPDGQALFGEAMALGDAARRLHRRGTLDPDRARALLAGVRGLAGRLAALLGAIHDAPEYRTAVAAYDAGDRAVLAPLLPVVFAGLEPVTPPPTLFAALPWRRRGRPCPPAELALEVVALRDDGLAAEGDDLSPGADARLPAVTLQVTPPLGEAVVLGLDAEALEGPAHRLVETGDHLVHAPRVRAPMTVLLAATPLEDERVVVDWEAYRAALARALTAVGIPVTLLPATD
jgi:hypothetical protein